MEIAKEKFSSDPFCKKFLLLNSNWLRENLKFVFTPKTLKTYKFININIFVKKIL